MATYSLDRRVLRCAFGTRTRRRVFARSVTVRLAAMLAAMAPREPHPYRGPHEATIKMSYVYKQHTHNILWLARLTTSSEFHLYYDI